MDRLPGLSARLVQWEESYQKVQAVGKGAVHALDCGISVGSTLEERTLRQEDSGHSGNGSKTKRWDFNEMKVLRV